MTPQELEHELVRDRQRAGIIVAATIREAARSHVWTDAEGTRWKVNPDGVWRWVPQRSSF